MGGVQGISASPIQNVGSQSFPIQQGANAKDAGIVVAPPESFKISGMAYVLLDHEDLIKLLFEFLLTKKSVSEEDILAKLAISKALLDIVSSNSPFVNVFLIEGQKMYSLNGTIDLSNMGALFSPASTC